MQMMMTLPSVRSNGLVASSASASAAAPLLFSLSHHRPYTLSTSSRTSPPSPLSYHHYFPRNPVHPLPSYPFLSSFFSTRCFPHPALLKKRENPFPAYVSSPTAPFPVPDEEAERAKLAQVSKRLENTSRYFKRLGSIGFWGQLVCTAVAAVILSFSAVITGKISSPATFYATAAGIAAAFVSVFWSFGYIRLSERLRKTASEPAKAPPRIEVVKGLKNGIVVNLLGMGATVLGMQATVGLLVAKALTTSAVPYYQGISPGGSPVLALDVFLVQASANTILSHFLGLVVSLELLRTVTLPQSEGVPVPRAA